MQKIMVAMLISMMRVRRVRLRGFVHNANLFLAYFGFNAAITEKFLYTQSNDSIW